jgi:hypothetical protein
MSLIDLPTAKAHLRVASDYPDVQVAGPLGAAEMMAAKFLNRNIYADQTALNAAIAAVPAALIAAGVAYEAAMTAAEAIDDAIAQDAAEEYASYVYAEAQDSARRTRAGIVIDDMIRAGALLILGHLFANREDTVVGVTVASLPQGSRAVLAPYRVSMGI